MNRLRVALTVGLLLGLVLITILGGLAFGAIVGSRLQAESMTESSGSISVQSDPDGTGPAGPNLRWASGAGVSARAQQSITVPTGSAVNQIQLFTRRRPIPRCSPSTWTGPLRRTGLAPLVRQPGPPGASARST
jgi:mannose/fructose/N-acetylgalactosamine-specific phosphotransferase system component IIC